MTITRRTLLCVALAFIAACGSLSSPPRDRFYRLHSFMPPTSLSTSPAKQLHVPPFEASGLHAKRALIYVHPDDTTLEQYSYHLWIDSPRLLLQSALSDYLREGLGAQVVAQPAAEATVVQGRVVRFERLARPGGGPDDAAVVLHFDVFEHGARMPSLSKSYAVVENLADDTIEAYAMAANRAVEQVFEQLLNDLAHLWR
ncbi:MAG: ABC-type transport auxiliary lipoprotein family protein [Gammaproteobacteria bacterium]